MNKKAHDNISAPGKTPAENPKSSDGSKENPPPRFKRHRAFESQSPAKVSGARRSRINPNLQVIELHEKSKKRIFIIFLAVTVVIGACLAAYYLHSQAQEKRSFEERISGQMKILEAFDEKIATAPAYEREVAARDAIRTTEWIMQLDPRKTAELRERIADYNEILDASFPVLVKDPADGMNFIAKSAMIDMVYIPPGEFYMGHSPDEPGTPAENEQPYKHVVLPYQFWMARTEVSVWQLRKLIPNYNIPPWDGYTLNHWSQPAASISYYSAELYCQKLTELERLAGRIPEQYEYRLPTEAEWEYACRAGTTTAYYWGNDFSVGAEYANSLDIRSARKFNLTESPGMAQNDKYYVSAPVASFKPNAFGLYDMSGNVSEWCIDWYAPDAYHETVTPERSPVQLRPVLVAYTVFRPFDAGTYEIEMTCKVVRGGSWGTAPDYLRSAKRDFMPPQDENTGVGFRPVLAPAIPTKTKN